MSAYCVQNYMIYWTFHGWGELVPKPHVDPCGLKATRTAWAPFNLLPACPSPGLALKSEDLGAPVSSAVDL